MNLSHILYSSASFTSVLMPFQEVITVIQEVVTVEVITVTYN